MITRERKDGRSLKHYGLKKGQMIYLDRYEGKAIATEKITSHVNTHELNKGQILHHIILEMNDGEEVSVRFSDLSPAATPNCSMETLQEICNDARWRGK